MDIRKNIFACLFRAHNTVSLLRHEQVCLIRLHFEIYFSHHWTRWKKKTCKCQIAKIFQGFAPKPTGAFQSRPPNPPAIKLRNSKFGPNSPNWKLLAHTLSIINQYKSWPAWFSVDLDRNISRISLNSAVFFFGAEI